MTDFPARRDAPLALDSATFRSLGHRLVDLVADGLAGVPAGPVTRGEAPAEIRAALGLGGPLPEQGADPAALLETTARDLFAHSLFNGHPRFFGYITSSPAPIGILADLLASAVNPNVGAFTLSPAATEIEVETVRWIAELIGYPGDCGGVLVSGGNMANFVGFWAARAAVAARGGGDVRAHGVAAVAPRLRIYASGETHTWIQKAADLSGLGTDAIRWIAVDADQRMDLAALRAAIAADRAAGAQPFLVVGTAGSVSTGAIDDLPAIAAIARAEDLWFHVDGAYGGFAAAAPEAPPALRGLALADSVAVDPHKWLYAPLEAGCALVRDRAKLTAAFSYHPAYYHLENEATNFVDYGMQNSRGFRALKVWLALRQAGAAGYRRMIGDDIRLTRVLADAVRATPGLEMTSEGLSIATFRLVPADLAARASEPAVADYLNALNQALLDRLQKGGEAFVSNAVLPGGRYVLRACIVNIHTQRADVEALPAIVLANGHALDAAMRPAALA
jgi:glutamate/tyrosine decarboxylase-like PLP-dependent enzyme